MYIPLHMQEYKKFLQCEFKTSGMTEDGKHDGSHSVTDI